MRQIRNPRVLVEDEALVAMLLEDMLSEVGYDAVEVISQVADGLHAAQTGAFAILDVNLGGANSFPIADVLTMRKIPFFFSTGYGAAGLDTRYAHIPTLQKPFLCSDLKAAIAALPLPD